MIVEKECQDVDELVIPGAPGAGRRVLDVADRGAGTVQQHALGLVRGHKKIRTGPSVTWMKHHDNLLGEWLRRLLAFEMLLQQMPNQPRGARAAFALGGEFGF
jgi:predicted ATPase